MVCNLMSHVRKLGQEFKMKYTEFVEGIISRGKAELVALSELESCEGWFLPHHGVYHKTTGKIRAVSTVVPKQTGVNLNDQLLQGIDINSSLLEVLLRFRQKSIAVSCDIEKITVSES